MKSTKPYNISKELIYEAYKRVKANKGSAGIDKQSLQAFELNLKNNLYKLWNRMSSGSYFPQAVKRVNIEKATGGTRPLGIPTVADRIAQMAVKMMIEPELEQLFHSNSYGYRPAKSAHQAVELAQKRCWKRAWVLDMDIKGFFDNIEHDLLMKAVNKHVKEAWQCLYIKRGLEAPVQHPDGRIEKRTKGIPQGGVISPLLANLFLHYVFDLWVEKNWIGIQFERYADDIVCHCRTEKEANALKQKLIERFKQCGLQLNPDKTQIIYCKSWVRKQQHENIQFDFLGFTFRPRQVKARNGKFIVCFLPAISQKAAKQIRAEINSWAWKAWTLHKVGTIIRHSKSRITGWLQYYGKFQRVLTIKVLFHLDKKLAQWAKRKYKKLKTLSQAITRTNAFKFRNPKLLAHW